MIGLGKIRDAVLALALLTLVWGAGPALAQDDRLVEVPPAQAAAIAQAALRDGRPDVALSIARAMLARDPDDATAHLIMAIVARDAGDLTTADAAATRAWRGAESDAQRFEAAFIAGDIAARQERWTSAQIWLRRADQFAPNAAAEETVARAYRGVSARNPIRVQLTFALRPSNNLNNGSDPDNEIDLGGLSGSAESRVSGIELAAGATLTFRLSESAVQRTEAIVQAYLRRAIMDGADYAEFNASTAGPISRNEFDYAQLALGIGHRRSVFEGLGPTGITGLVGANYYRNTHLSNFAELTVTQDVPAGERAFFRFGAALRDERRFDSPAASYVSTALSVDWFGRGEGAVAYSLGATLTDFDSDAGTVDGRQVQLRGRYTPDVLIFGARPDLGASVTAKELPEALLSDFSIGERRDVTARVALGLTFEGVRWYGFQPRVEFTASDTNSTDDLWDRRALGVGATLVSRF